MMQMKERRKKRKRAAYSRAYGLAGLAEGVDPGDQHFVEGRLKVEEFDTHANAWLDDADDNERFEDLSSPDEFHAGAGLHGQRFAGADKTSAERDVGGDAIHLFAGFEIDQFNISGKRKADGVAAITDSRDVGIRSITVGHGDDFVHLMHPEIERGGRSLVADQASTYDQFAGSARGWKRGVAERRRKGKPPQKGARREVISGYDNASRKAEPRRFSA
jgi:hypothetical protein